MERIVLIGFRGSGKTVVGRALASSLSVPFIDTDELVEKRAEMSIPEIFESQGEEEFRSLERYVIDSLPSGEAVVSTGGGAVMDSWNVQYLRAGSRVFFLQASAQVTEERIRGSERPPLTEMPLHEEIEALIAERMAHYISTADVCIDTGSCSVAEVCTKIMQVIREGTGTAGSGAAALDFLRQTPLPAPVTDEFERALGRNSGICGIAGNPCMHSRSPLLYNRLYEKYGLNYHYTYFQWPDVGTIIDHARALGIRGLSVTIPFKQAVMKYIDHVDAHAGEIGAVNTVVQCGGVMYGSNTDWYGVKRPLEECRGQSAVVFGAGGAAAASVYALKALDMEVTILNRTGEKAAVMAERFDCNFGLIGDYDSYDPDVVVNATSVGMYGRGGALVTRDRLRKGMTVFDLVYTPAETELLKEAAAAGCTCISGEEMFIHQACEQFRLFTGIEVSPELVRELMQ